MGRSAVFVKHKRMRRRWEADDTNLVHLVLPGAVRVLADDNMRAVRRVVVGQHAVDDDGVCVEQADARAQQQRVLPVDPLRAARVQVFELAVKVDGPPVRPHPDNPQVRLHLVVVVGGRRDDDEVTPAPVHGLGEHDARVAGEGGPPQFDELGVAALAEHCDVAKDSHDLVAQEVLGGGHHHVRAVVAVQVDGGQVLKRARRRPDHHLAPHHDCLRVEDQVRRVLPDKPAGDGQAAQLGRARVQHHLEPVRYLNVLALDGEVARWVSDGISDPALDAEDFFPRRGRER